MTSFDVIRELRKKTGMRKFGHAGTLDPLASGLMILGFEEGTKKLTEYIGLDKEYEAEILIGEKRSTSDMEGKVLACVSVDTLEKSTVQDTLHSMVGKLTLPVSAYSAMKKAGVPMYKRARKAEKEGKLVTDVPIREMEVYEAKLISVVQKEKKVIVKVVFKVGSGTYIRSLAEELGKRLGYPATLYTLRRTKIGEFDVEKAQTLDQV